MTCPWCHNPESRHDYIESYDHTDKIGNKSFASKKNIGEYYTLEELLSEVLKDKLFYKESDGGITCSGGEPLLQSQFLKQFLKKCKDESLHTAVDTSGYAENDILKRVAPDVDLFLFDIKHLDALVHLHYTGVSNDLILKNFEWLVNSGHPVIARIPVIPGINADKKTVHEMVEYMERQLRPNFREVHLLPYHRTGCGKYKKFNINNHQQYKVPPVEMMEEISHLFRENGFITKIGG